MVTGIVLAAGRATRMGGGPNKQFVELSGKPLIWYSLTAFEQCGLDPAVAIGTMREANLAVLGDRGVPTRQVNFSGKKALGVVLRIQFVRGFDPADFSEG